MSEPTVAVLGASQDRRKFGNKAVRAYRDCGLTVLPVNPREATIEGLAAYPNLEAIDGPLDYSVLRLVSDRHEWRYIGVTHEYIASDTAKNPERLPALSVVHHEDGNLFWFIHHSLAEVCAHLQINTEIRASSSLPVDKELRSQDKVLAICGALGAKRYINPIGGTELYVREDFAARGIELQFLKPRTFEYAQFGNEFVPWLSIIDVLMFNPIEVVRERLEHHFDLV